MSRQQRPLRTLMPGCRIWMIFTGFHWSSSPSNSKALRFTQDLDAEQRQSCVQDVRTLQHRPTPQSAHRGSIQCHC